MAVVERVGVAPSRPAVDDACDSDPARSSRSARSKSRTPADVAAALERARKAQPEWAALPSERDSVLLDARCACWWSTRRSSST